MKQKNELLGGVCGNRLPLTGVEVAKTYNGASTNESHSESTQTIVQMSQTAIRHDMSVIEALDAFIDEERPEAKVKTKQLRPTGLSVFIAESECRVFKTFVAFHSLCISGALLSEKNTTIQIDTFYKLR